MQAGADLREKKSPLAISIPVDFKSNAIVFTQILNENLRHLTSTLKDLR
jgi:hypothetical protein